MPAIQSVPCTPSAASESDRTLHFAPDTLAGVVVLAVTASDADWSDLQHLFNQSRWKLARCRGVAEARGVLLTSAVPTVLCDAALPDGDWKGLVEFLSCFRNPPRVIVMANLADDRLWDSVLNMGAYDLLEKPLRGAELYRSVSDAWHGWKLETARAAL